MSLSVDSVVASWCSETPGCRGNLGVPRSAMPQIKPEFRSQFFTWVAKKYGAKTTMKVWKARDLAATQKEIDTRRIKSLLNTGAAFMRDHPMIVSKDGYVLDGHHRWAANLTENPDTALKTYTVNLPIRELLKAAAAFPNAKSSPLDFDLKELKKHRSAFTRTSAAAVAPVRQRTQYTCMATSMMMCLQANGMECDEDEVNRVMGARAMQGASWEDAIACAQHYGMRSTLICPATVRQLKEFTDRGVPVMIAWNPEGRDWSHASVVFDVDDNLNVHVADPNIPDPDETVRIVSKGEFYKKWAEKWPNYLVRRPAMAIEREITPDGRQVVASNNHRKASSGTEQAISLLHPEMAQAIASGISGGRAMKADYWASVVHLPRDVAKGIYLQTGSQEHPRTGGMSVYVSVWTPTLASDKSWRSLFVDIADVLEKYKSAMGRYGKAKVHDLGKAFKVWLEVPSDKILDAVQNLPKAVKRIGSDVNALLKKAGRTASNQETIMSEFTQIYPPIHPTVESMFRQAKPSVSKKDIERALKGAGLKYKYVSTDGGSFLVSGLGPLLSDAVDIELDHKGGAPQDADRWIANVGNRTVKLESRRDLSKLVDDMKKKHDSYKGKSASENAKNEQEKKMQSKKATDALWAGLGDALPEVERLIQAKETDESKDDGDKESKFEKGEDVPVSELPKELRENVKDPPPSVKKLKKKLKKKADDGQLPEKFSMVLEPDDIVPTGTVVDLGNRKMIVAKSAVIDNSGGKVIVAMTQYNDNSDKAGFSGTEPFGAVEESTPLSTRSDYGSEFTAGRGASAIPSGNLLIPPEFSGIIMLDGEPKSGLPKEAGKAPGGLYGFPKKVQADCEAAARKLQRVAIKIASEAVKRDGKVAAFWADRAKKAKSGTAKMLLAALEANKKFAAERGEQIEVGTAPDKEAAVSGYGYYGYRAKTANRAFSACLALKEAAGEIGASLHARRAGQHGRIVGFLGEHAKKSKCAASKMILHGYPEAASKTASSPVEDPNSVAQWLEFEGD